MKVLVADDDPVSRTLMVGILQSANSGYNLLAVTDGEDAWKALEANADVKLAILDLSMPGLGGMQLIDRMRADARFAALPVIICTGTADRATVTAAAARGISHFLVKPFSRTTVLEKVWNICRPPVSSPVLDGVSEVRQKLEIDRDTHRELLEQALRMADMWASNAVRANEYPRVRALALLAPHIRLLLSSLGAVGAAAKFQEAEQNLGPYRRRPLQSEEAACFRVIRTIGEKLQRELDRLRDAIHSNN